MKVADPPSSWAWLHRALQPTRWSLVARLRDASHTAQERHGAEFCRGYWYPLYCWLRASGHTAPEAQDYVQSFLARLLHENLLASADPQRGRLWNFLITLLRRHVAAQREYTTAQKRGGRAPHLPLDWTEAENAWQQEGRAAGTPEECYRQALAVQLVQLGMAALRETYAAKGNAALLEAMLPALEGPLPDETFDSLATRLDMKPGTLRAAAQRMRQRFEKHVKSSASIMLDIPEGPLLDAELRDLFCGPPRHATL